MVGYVRVYEDEELEKPNQWPEHLGNLIAREAWMRFEEWLAVHSDLLEDLTLVEMVEIYSKVDGRSDLREILSAAIGLFRK